MSLILEALRKSEAERRRGEAPGLRVELPPVAASRRPAVPAWTWIAGVVVVLSAMLYALWPRDGGSDADDRADTTPAAPMLAVVPPADGPAERVGTGTDAIGVRDAFPRVERIAPTTPPPAGTVAMDEPAPSEGSASNPPAAPVAAAAADPLPATPAAPPSRAAAGSVTTDASTAAAPRPDTRPDADIPRITELASAQRQRLPAMKLSMHMWNEDPARRFVVIDGQRKVEGDRVGEATIAAIDRDGVVLDLDGRQVRVPLP
ncbi:MULTISPECIES: general secretion pathway protein GspB [unclassified Luteimonas]